MLGRSIITVLLVLALFVAKAAAQRVQIPSTTAESFAAPNTFAAPGYATPGYAAPNYATPGYAAPPPTATLGAPTNFDPYAMPSVQGGFAPPPQTPYSFPQPTTPGWPGAAPAAPGLTPYAQPGGPPIQGIYPDGLPYQWQQGSYGVAGADGTQVSWQRLLERIGFEQTYLYGGNSADDLGWNRTEIAATFAYPLFHNIETPLFITPGFAFNFIDGPSGDPTAVPRGPDLPGQVYDAYLDLSWYPQPAQWLGAELGIRTGVWTDFSNVSSDALRILGRGLVVVSTSPQLDVLVGVVYLDRIDVKLLPAGGLRWRPSPEWDFYLVFPNPKIRKRLTTIGTADWSWYVAGEYGGGSWAASRSGLDDRFDYNDIRFVGGLEWETQTHTRGHIEVGYVFNRELIFASGMPSGASLNDTFMLRGGIDF